MDNKIIKKNEPTSTSTISLIPYFNDTPVIITEIHENETQQKGLGEILFEASPVIAGVVTIISVGVIGTILIRRRLSSS